jgi:hypothetical protein
VATISTDDPLAVAAVEAIHVGDVARSSGCSSNTQDSPPPGSATTRPTTTLA